MLRSHRFERVRLERHERDGRADAIRLTLEGADQGAVAEVDTVEVPDRDDTTLRWARGGLEVVDDLHRPQSCQTRAG